MHELVIMENILQIAVDFAQRNRAKEIHRIDLAVGTFSGIVPQYAESFFRMVAKGTIAENAVLQFDIAPAQFQCTECGTKTTFTSAADIIICKNCGSDRVRLLSGREFRVQSMEILEHTEGGSDSG